MRVVSENAKLKERENKLCHTFNILMPEGTIFENFSNRPISIY